MFNFRVLKIKLKYFNLKTYSRTLQMDKTKFWSFYSNKVILWPENEKLLLAQSVVVCSMAHNE